MHRLIELSGVTPEDIGKMSEGIYAIAASTTKQYTWQEKIDNLVELAKAVGTYLKVEVEDPGTDGHRDARTKLKDAYDTFCEWRHDEPFVADEIRMLFELYSSVKKEITT